ncbi:hypothetical protein IWW35_004590 [Coemansia sp. RSA 1878]|nr:hypothetical protein IWW35_004590 [Coemansia sp. RSA 1878]
MSRGNESCGSSSGGNKGAGCSQKSPSPPSSRTPRALIVVTLSVSEVAGRAVSTGRGAGAFVSAGPQAGIVHAGRDDVHAVTGQPRPIDMAAGSSDESALVIDGSHAGTSPMLSPEPASADILGPDTSPAESNGTVSDGNRERPGSNAGCLDTPAATPTARLFRNAEHGKQSAYATIRSYIVCNRAASPPYRSSSVSQPNGL